MKLHNFQVPRGTADILPNDQKYWKYFQNKAKETASLFGYERIDTPTFEDAGLFLKGTGETTDIIEKETYTFEDRGGDLLTLRPEGTPPVCRAYMENGMHNLPQPVRLYYTGPFYRYDRPQAGRYRQLHQFGIELIGESDPSVDAEVIEMALRLLQSMGLKDSSLLLNSIGDSKCRPQYIAELQAYYNSNLAQLAHQDCLKRLGTNPLRLLDCKFDSCQSLIASAPSALDYLCKDCEKHWASLLGHLENLSIPAIIEKRLVRGLDYYTRTVFEIIPPTEGQQNTIVAGGRYDGLIERLGGRPTPAIGFGMGIERVIINLKRLNITMPNDASTKVLLVHMQEESKKVGLALCSKLRLSGIAAIVGPTGRSLKGQLRYASAINATHAVIIGEHEINQGTIIIRDMAKSEQQSINPEDLVQFLTTTQLSELTTE